jgi:prephenate dehydratase
MDGLADGDPLVITQEMVLPVTMTLVARPGTALADLGIGMQMAAS